MITVLIHTKVNRSAKELPIGFRWGFGRKTISVERDFPVMQTKKKPTVWSSIVSILRDEGQRMRAVDIADKLGKGYESTRQTLREMARKKEIKRFDDKTYGLWA